MILQALVRSYDALAADGKLDQPGWLEAKVSWSIELDADGRLKQVIPQGSTDEKGKSIARSMKIPAMAKRSSGIAANFLCDNAMYMLGVDLKGKKARAMECFRACAARHLELLEHTDEPFARAICAFFKTWDAENAESHPLIAPILELLKAGGNLVFSMNEAFAQDVPEIRAAWNSAYGDQENAVRGRCLVTGEEGAIAILHPSIKGVAGAQATGASLVSFNAPSYESYGRREAQGLNAPVSERAAFAYGAALNYMLRERDYRMRLGTTTMVFWAEGAAREYGSALAWMLGNADDGVDQAMLENAAADLRRGKTAFLNGVPLHPENPFYVLGLAPNASRLSVRFFMRNSFQAFAVNLNRHQERLKIVGNEKRREMSVWALLNETVNPKSTDKKPPDVLVGEVLRAILSDAPYPASLFAQVEVRLRAEQNVTFGKAAIIKAYLIKNVVRDSETHPMKEVLTVKLNEEASYAPYVLGRLFAVLEKIQISAMKLDAPKPDVTKSNPPKSSATIRDRYFSSACATPAAVFPTLIRLAQSHLSKLSKQDIGSSIYYEQLIQNLYGKITETLPRHLSLEEQGAFQIGYYHQKQALYTKKEDRNDG